MRISDWSSDVCSSDLFTEFLGLQILARGLYGNHMRFGEGCFDKFLHIAARHNGNAGTFLKASQATAPAQRRWINQQDADAQIRAIDRQSTRLNSSPECASRMQSSA